MILVKYIYIFYLKSICFALASCGSRKNSFFKNLYEIILSNCRKNSFLKFIATNNALERLRFTYASICIQRQRNSEKSTLRKNSNASAIVRIVDTNTSTVHCPIIMEICQGLRSREMLFPSPVRGNWISIPWNFKAESIIHIYLRIYKSRSLPQNSNRWYEGLGDLVATIKVIWLVESIRGSNLWERI